MSNISILKMKAAVAGVIEALLLVALVSIIISMIQIYYIPQSMEQREAEHMDEVENQFSYLKSVIDLQSLVKENVAISSPVTLGSRELPYFVTARAVGRLEIIDIDYTDDKIVTDSISGVPLTSIKYSAYNSYFLNQFYILEGGCVILKQPDGETVKVEPSIIVENRSSEIRIYYNIPVIKSIPGKNSSAIDYKNCFVRTNYSGQDTYPPGLTSYIRIYTDYLNAWNSSLNKILEHEIKHGYIDIKKYPVDSPEYVRIEPNSKNIYLELTVSYIVAQIGTGIIIS